MSTTRHCICVIALCTSYLQYAGIQCTSSMFMQSSPCILLESRHMMALLMNIGYSNMLLIWGLPLYCACTKNKEFHAIAIIPSHTSMHMHSDIQTRGIHYEWKRSAMSINCTLHAHTLNVWALPRHSFSQLIIVSNLELITMWSKLKPCSFRISSVKLS